LLLAQLIFDREDGGDNFLRNIGSYTNYMAPYPRRWLLSISSMAKMLNFEAISDKFRIENMYEVQSSSRSSTTTKKIIICKILQMHERKITGPELDLLII
jgi:hypothetical protein